MDIQTKLLFEGDGIRAESLANGTPLARPIYFKHYLNGCYLSIADAERIAAELLTACMCAKAALPKPDAGTP